MPLFKLATAARPGTRPSKRRGRICCAATPASDPVVSGWSVSRFGHGRRPRSKASRLSPISDLRAAGRHRRASRLHNRTEGVVARHTVSRPEKLVEEVALGPGADVATSTAVWLPSDRRKAAEGKWTALTSVLPNRKNYPKYKIAFDIHQGISDEYQ